jgi:hypothetical protein
MRSFSLWAAVAALALAAGARGEDAYTIKLKHAPEVGKTITVKESNSKTQTTKLTDGEGNVLEAAKKTTEAVAEVYTETVLEMGDKAAKKYKRTYEKATRTRDGKAEARSYEGRTLLFEEKDGKYTVTAEGGKPISKEDLDELTYKANDAGAARDEALLPGKPIKVGDSWKVGGKELARAFEKSWDGKMDPDRSSATGKLVKVYKQDGHPFGVIEMALALAPTPPPGAKDEKPLVLDMKLTLDTAIDGSTTAGVLTMSGGLAGKGTFEQKGKKVTADFTVELSGRREQSAEK